MYHYYVLEVSLDRCHRRCSTFDDLSIRICALNKTGGVNLNIFSVITGKMNKDKSKTYFM